MSDWVNNGLMCRSIIINKKESFCEVDAIGVDYGDTKILKRKRRALMFKAPGRMFWTGSSPAYGSPSVIVMELGEKDKKEYKVVRLWSESYTRETKKEIMVQAEERFNEI